MLEKTSIEIMGITVIEPVATVTDLLISFVCFYSFIVLKNHPYKKTSTIKLYRSYFLFMALATCYGGIVGHGFLYMFSFKWKLPGWILSMISVGLIERASIMHAKPLIPKNVGRFFAWLNIFEFLILLLIVIYSLNFIYVEAHAAYGFLIVLFTFELFIFIKTKDNGSKKILLAVIFAGLAAAVHIGKFNLHKWLNYIDLAHLLMIIGSVVLYYAVADMKLHEKK